MIKPVLDRNVGGWCTVVIAGFQIGVAMSNMQTLIQQKIALLQEAEIALYSIETGLGHLAKNRPYAPKPYYFAWFILLSTGFERLFKILICLHEFETTGTFPTRRFLQRTMRHDLLTLRDEVVRRCYVHPYLDRDFAQDDRNFLATDTLLVHILSALNDFANEDRYMFMNKISEPDLGREWPKMRWEEIERIALSDDVFYRLLQDDYQELVRQANRLTQAHIERFTRALTRLFVFGNLGDLAQSQYALIAEFVHLEDSQLGIRVYER
jgi:hypothetical protein